MAKFVVFSATQSLSPAQVDFYMEPVKEPLAGDMCLPGWAAKVVSRADQAWFESKLIKHNVVIYITSARREADSGPEPLSFDIKHIEGKCKDEIEALVQDRPHVVVPVSIQCLSPVPDIAERLDKDVQETRKALEKSMRSWISNAVKAKTKSVKKKKGKAGDKDKDKLEDKDKVEAVEEKGLAGKEAEKIFESLGMEMPGTKQEQVDALKSLIAEESKLESVIEKAKASVAPLTHLPLTKLSEDGSKANRSKVMQDALNAVVGKSEASNNADAAAGVNAKLGLQLALKQQDFTTKKSAKDSGVALLRLRVLALQFTLYTVYTDTDH